MKKYIQLIIIFILFSTSLYSADSLDEFFSKGKVKGVIKSYYFSKDYEGNSVKDANIFVNGGSLGFVSDELNGFKVGVTFQTSHVTSVDDKSNKYRNTMNASGTVMSESFIEYRHENSHSNIKVGRQFMNTPMVAGSLSRLIIQSYESYVLTNTALSNTKIVAAYVDKFQARTDGDGGVPKFEKAGIEGVNTLFVQNSSVSNLLIKAQFIDVKKDYESVYADATYKFDSTVKPFLGFRFFGTNHDASGEKSSTQVGIKTGVTIVDINFFTSFTKTDKDGDIERGVGFGTEALYSAITTSPTTSSFRAGAETFQVGASYNFGKLYSRLFYTTIDLPTNGTSITTANLDETTLNLRYKFGGKFKGLSASIDFSLIDSGIENQEKNTLRTKVKYSF